MTKIERLQKERGERLNKLSKRELIDRVMMATIFSDTYFLIKSSVPMSMVGLDSTIRAMHKALNVKSI